MLEDLVRECIGTVFPGETVLSAAVFRVTRNGDIAVQEEDALDLADEMEGSARSPEIFRMREAGNRVLRARPRMTRSCGL